MKATAYEYYEPKKSDIIDRLLLKEIKESDNMSKVRLKSFKFSKPTIEIGDDFLISNWDIPHYGLDFLWERKPKPKMKRLPEKYIEGIKKKTGEKSITLFWGDDIKTSVVCSKNDKYDKRLGFLIAYFQYNSGLSKTQANKYLDNLTEEVKK